MKIIILLIVAFSQFSWAEKTGNGGGGWVCRNANQTIRWAVLVDLFEAEASGLKINRVETDPQQQFDEAIARLRVANERFYNALLPYINLVASKWPGQGDSELKVVDDALYSRIPRRETCPNGMVEYGQVVNFKDTGVIEVDENLRKSLYITDQAALRMHEPIYALLRDRIGDVDSVLAREMVGYLFSDRDPSMYGKLFDLNFFPKPGIYGDVNSKLCGYIVRIDKATRRIGFTSTANPWDKEGIRCGQHSTYIYQLNPKSKTLLPVDWKGRGSFRAPLIELADEETVEFTIYDYLERGSMNEIKFKKEE